MQTYLISILLKTNKLYNAKNILLYHKIEWPLIWWSTSAANRNNFNFRGKFHALVHQAKETISNLFKLNSNRKFEFYFHSFRFVDGMRVFHKYLSCSWHILMISNQFRFVIWSELSSYCTAIGYVSAAKFNWSASIFDCPKFLQLNPLGRICPF